MLNILFEDESLVLVDKPIDLPIHKNDHMPHDAPYLTKLVGDQLGQWVYNVHRLDAKTSGVVLLALSSEMAKVLTQQFANRDTEKLYTAIVKGVPGAGCWDNKVLDRKKGRRVTARTDFATIETVITNLHSKGMDDVPLSKVELRPYTGRWHQLRQHCSQQRYDIIGDTQHGDWTLNRLITEHTEARRLMLHATQLSFDHPLSGERITANAPLPALFESVLQHWQ